MSRAGRRSAGETLHHRAERVAFALARGLWSVLPERAALASGAGLGLLAGVLLRIRRSDVDRHLRLAFPERSRSWRDRIARRSYAHLGREAALIFRRDGLSAEQVISRTEVVGFEAFSEAAAQASGVVLLTGHLGNWELGGAAIAARGIPLDVVGKGMANRRFEEAVFSARERLGMRVVEMSEAPKQALSALGRGRVVALLGDQNAHGGGVFIPFFGRPASTARGPALFALRTGAPVFVAFAVRAERGAYVVTFERLSFTRTGQLDLDIETVLRAYTELLEKAVVAAPEQYFWQHRRWKKRPPEEPTSEG